MTAVVIGYFSGKDFISKNKSKSYFCIFDTLNTFTENTFSGPYISTVLMKYSVSIPELEERHAKMWRKEGRGLR